jgi:hypothetical protein
MSYTNGLDKPTDYFNTVLYTGTGVSRNQTGVGFDPDWVWIKCRSDATTDNVLFDRVRTAGQRLVSNDTGEEETQTGIMSAFVTDGVTLGTGGVSNSSGRTYVMWNWLANGAGVSNTAGTISSTVSANTTSGFSIVSYTGTGSASTVGHGLSSTPQVYIIKDRTNARNWQSYHEPLGNQAYLRLNTTGSASTGASIWNNTSPTSSVFSIGTSSFDAVNASGDNYIAYCFAEVKGYSKFSSYTGNGSTDGTFVYTGFKPAWVMVKRTDSTDTWNILDNKRRTINPNINRLFADLNNAEVTSGDRLDFLSNGFKLRTTNGDHNASGGTYIYMCFAENPFVTSTGIPTTAR